jgi:two-component system sensor histidine kinase AtoS
VDVVGSAAAVRDGDGTPRLPSGVGPSEEGRGRPHEARARPPLALRLLSGSIVRRYSLLLLASALLPMVVVGVLYDRYTRSLLDQFTGEQLNAQLAATASRLGAFLEARAYQLQTVARYPATPSEGREDARDELASLVRLEADEADLYGILFFSEQGELVQAVGGQAASGPPYWAGLSFDLDGLPRRRLGETELIGPVPPRDGQPGWFLMRESLHGGGMIALHVRLASVTELLGASSAAGVLQPILRTPAGDLDVVGRPVVVHGQLLDGPELAPGWRPGLVVDPEELLRPFQAARYTLLVAALVAAAAVGWGSVRLARRLKHRVDMLAHGAERLSAGDFAHQVPVAGEDEIGLLALAFNRMASRLGELVDRTVRMERLAALGSFSTGVAHEVRNPLATLKTTVQALERVERDPQRSVLLRDMGREIDRMARALGEILAFGRPRPPQRAAIRAWEVARRLRTLVATEGERRQVDFTVQGDPYVLAQVDPDHLQQILMNLVLNALQATPAGGLVTLRIHREGDAVAVEVRDTGAGIPADKLPEVFEPFYTTKPSGTGLGLSISRQLAELNGGSLTLESASGQGTTARVLLATPEKELDVERPHH